MLLRTSFLLYVTLFVLGCVNESGVKTYHDNGAVYETYTINEDSLRHGNYFKFYENGDTLEKAFYIDGKLNGKRVLFFEGNRPEIEETYINDSLSGEYIVYYDDGNISLVTRYEQNELNDIVRRYYPSGAVMEEVTFVENIENGPFTEYYENGSKKWEGTYKDGDNEYGLLIQFSDTGDTIKKMMCDEMFICRTIYENPDYAVE